MATTARKRKTKATKSKSKSKAKSKPKAPRSKKTVRKARKSTAKRRTRRAPRRSRAIDMAVAEKMSALSISAERLVVRLAPDSHPELFDIDRIIKQVQKLNDAHRGDKKMRDLCEFLVETEKSLQIILSNHLEDALRKFLR